MTELETLKTQLKRLGLTRIAAIFEDEATRALTVKSSYTSYLGRLIKEEHLAQSERSVNYRIRNARFPGVKTLEGFDFRFQPSVSEIELKELAGLGFITRAENIILIGPPGVGKTHLAIGL